MGSESPVDSAVVVVSSSWRVLWLFCWSGRPRHHPRILRVRQVSCRSCWWSLSRWRLRHHSAAQWRQRTWRAPVRRHGVPSHFYRWSVMHLSQFCLLIIYSLAELFQTVINLFGAITGLARSVVNDSWRQLLLRWDQFMQSSWPVYCSANEILWQNTFAVCRCLI